MGRLISGSVSGAVTGNDLVSRFGDPDAGASGWVEAAGPATSPVEQRRLESVLQNDIAAGPENTVASWVWNFDQEKYRLASMINTGDFAGAGDYYDGLKKIINDNRDSIITLATTGSTGGATGRVLAERANGILTGASFESDVNVFGQRMSMRTALESPEVAAEVGRSGLSNYGFSDAVGQMYFSGTDSQRKALRAVVDPFVAAAARAGSVTGVANRIQLQELADDVVGSWGDIEGTFGDGSAQFVQNLQDMHAGSGGAAPMLKSLVDLGRDLADSSGLSGKDLVRNLMSGYRDLMSSVYQSSAPRTDRNGRPVSPAPITADQQLFVSSSLRSAVRAAKERGVSVDLRDPSVKRAITEMAGLNSYLESFGEDLFSEARRVGSPIQRHIGDAVVDRMTGTVSPGNVMESVIGLRHMLATQFTGGRDFSAATFDVSGQPADYLSSLAHSARGWSSAPEMDGIAVAAQQYLMKKMLPGVLAGRLPDDAWNDMLSSGPTAYRDFVGGLSDSLVKFFHGEGRVDAASAVADEAVRRFQAGQPVSFEDIAIHLADEVGGTDSSTPVVRSLKNWCIGNTDYRVEYAMLTKNLQDQLVADGRSAQSVSAIMSRVNARAVEARRSGRDPADVYRAYLRSGSMLFPQYARDRNGNFVKGPDGNPVLQDVQVGYGNRDQYGFIAGGIQVLPGDFTNDPVKYYAGQEELRRQKRDLEDQRQKAMLVRASEEAKQQYGG